MDREKQKETIKKMMPSLVKVSDFNFDFIPLRLRKAGRVWCGGARETHLAKESLKSPCFFRSEW